jgi:hypothetical protein
MKLLFKICSNLFVGRQVSLEDNDSLIKAILVTRRDERRRSMGLSKTTTGSGINLEIATKLGQCKKLLVVSILKSLVNSGIVENYGTVTIAFIRKTVRLS